MPKILDMQRGVFSKVFTACSIPVCRTQKDCNGRQHNGIF